MKRLLPLVLQCLLPILALLVAGCVENDVPPATAADTAYAEQMAEQHAGETPHATAMAREPGPTVEGDTVMYGQIDGQALQGYLARPANADSAAEALGLAPGTSLPGIVVVHEWWGLNDNIRTMARRLAGEGMHALAVDIYGGEVARDPSQARELMQQATQDQEQIVANVRAALQHLSEEVGVSQTGIIGWCFGGGVALNAAIAEPERLDAAVIYYGHLVTDSDRLQRIDMPVIGFFGAEDGSIPVDSVRAFESALSEVSDEPVQVHVYEGAGHAFANPSGERYVPEAAEDSWQKTVQFLREHLVDGTP